ncbi:MAG: hypothetical protein RLZZ610_439 [Actinomycetota bacterium]|jgi:glucose-6-phosphate isomerase
MTLKVVHKASVSEAVLQNVPSLVNDKVASRIFQKDFTLWGEDAEDESKKRLGWVNAARSSLVLIPDLLKLRDDLHSEGVSRVVLCGMGGSSLAPEVITKTFGTELVVLDSTEPSQVSDVVSKELGRTVVVVSSKSGSTVETDSQKRSFEAAFEAAGIDRRERIVIVTDPGSPMESEALGDGYRVFTADPTVGGRYSALTAFGVVPSVLAGVDMESVLHSAIAAERVLAKDSESNPGLILGAALARTAAASGFKDKLGLIPNGTSIVGFGDWAEQLIAESTGKDGKGVLPVVLESHSPEIAADHDDLLLIGLGEDASTSPFDLTVSGDLGEQMLLWEFATAVASRLLGINPFDQPDVEAAKVAARSMLEATKTEKSPVMEQIKSYGFALAGTTLESAIDSFIRQALPSSYFSIQCYLNRLEHAEASGLRDLLAVSTNRPITFGWGPRFLHSTGQYHKGGPKQGLFLQILSAEELDLDIPGRPFSYKELIDSQALGDAKVLESRGLKVLSLRLPNVREGLQAISSILGKREN